MPSRSNPNVPSKQRRIASRSKVQKRGISKNPRGTARSSVLNPTSGKLAPVSGKKARKLEKAKNHARRRALERAMEMEGEVVMTGQYCAAGTATGLGDIWLNFVWWQMHQKLRNRRGVRKKRSRERKWKSMRFRDESKDVPPERTYGYTLGVVLRCSQHGSVGKCQWSCGLFSNWPGSCGFLRHRIGIHPALEKSAELHVSFSLIFNLGSMWWLGKSKAFSYSLSCDFPREILLKLHFAIGHCNFYKLAFENCYGGHRFEILPFYMCWWKGLWCFERGINFVKKSLDRAISSSISFPSSF